MDSLDPSVLHFDANQSALIQQYVGDLKLIYANPLTTFGEQLSGVEFSDEEFAFVLLALGGSLLSQSTEGSNTALMQYVFANLVSQMRLAAQLQNAAPDTINAYFKAYKRMVTELGLGDNPSDGLLRVPFNLPNP